MMNDNSEMTYIKLDNVDCLVVEVSIGYGHVGVVTESGGLYMWGDNSCC
jgi:alpha-tubulin suppressor-like RCC1 family protein